jgi:hypothetical protein
MRRPGYPDDWPELSLAVRTRAKGRCECRSECARPGRPVFHKGRCKAIIGRPTPYRAPDFTQHTLIPGMPPRGPKPPAIVVLHTAHLDRDKGRDMKRMKAMCQKCHANYDNAHNVATVVRNRAARGAAKRARLYPQGDLFSFVSGR